MANKWSKKRSVMRRYNLTAQIYDERYREEQEAKYKAALNDLSINNESVVLDVGCGTGLFFSSVSVLANTVIGADVSKELLLLAKRQRGKSENVFLVLADADHLPFKKDVFDFVFAFTVLQNMPRPEETLTEFKYSAKHNCRFVITGLKAAISLESLGALIETAGFQVIALKDHDILRCNVVTCIQQ
jgi:ubiquinone/menaquinone biosynthesis C-methylase UbiE